MLWYRGLKKDLQGPSSQQVYFTSSIFQLKLSWCVHIQCAGVVGMRGLDPQRVCSKFSPVLSVETSWRLDETGHRRYTPMWTHLPQMYFEIRIEVRLPLISFELRWKSHVVCEKRLLDLVSDLILRSHVAWTQNRFTFRPLKGREGVRWYQ